MNLRTNMAMKPECPIEFTQARVFCSKHGEPFRKNWPNGYLVFITTGLDLLLNSEKFQEECQGQTPAIQRALDLLPLCCRLTSKEILNVYYHIHKELQLFTVDRCFHCSAKTLGTSCEYKVRLETRTIKHLCFECLVYHLDEVITRIIR